MSSVQQKLWCLKSVREPGLVRQKLPIEFFLSHRGVITIFVQNLQGATFFYFDKKFLNEESALLERCIYRMKLKFHSDKGFKDLQKLLKSFKMYYVVDIAKIIKSILSISEVNPSKKEFTFPGISNLEFLLVRLQTVAKLMDRIINIIKEAALYLQKIIRSGLNWKILTICVGVVSRLREIAVRILEFTYNFYGIVKPCYDCMQGDSWLPKDYCLPDYLRSWINENDDDIVSDDSEDEVTEENTSLKGENKDDDELDDSEDEVTEENISLKGENKDDVELDDSEDEVIEKKSSLKGENKDDVELDVSEDEVTEENTSLKGEKKDDFVPDSSPKVEVTEENTSPEDENDRKSNVGEEMNNASVEDTGEVVERRVVNKRKRGIIKKAFRGKKVKK